MRSLLGFKRIQIGIWIFLSNIMEYLDRKIKPKKENLKTLRKRRNPKCRSRVSDFFAPLASATFQRDKRPTSTGSKDPTDENED